MTHKNPLIDRLLACGYPTAWLMLAGALQAPSCFSAGPAPQESARSDAQMRTVVLQLKWRHQFQFAGYYAAIEKGFYSAANMEVRLVEGLPEIDSVEEVSSGRAEYGVGQAQLLLSRAQGKPIVVLAAIFQHSPDVLVARKDAGVTSPQDVVGRTIVLGAPGAVAVRAMLLREGVNLDKLKVLENAPNRASLLSGRAAIVGGYVTDLPFLLDRAGIPNTVINPINYGIDFYGDCLFTSEQELRRHPDRVRAFREASLRGWEYAMAHPQEIVDLIVRRYPSALDREELTHEADAMRSLMLPDLIEIGHMNPGRWRNMADISAELGLIPKGLSLDGFLYEPNPRPNYAWLFWTLAIVSAGLLTFGGGASLLWIHNRQLQKAVQLRTLELKKSEEKFAKAFLVSPFTMAIRRLRDNRYVEVNEVFEQRTDYRREELLGHTPEELGIFESPGDLAHVGRLLETEGRVRNLECRFRSKTGEPRIGLLSSELIELDGEPCVLSVAAEITELKQKEAELHRRNRELTLLNKVMAATATEVQPRAVLEVACRELALAFDLPQASAFLMNEGSSAVVCIAEYAASGRPSLLGRTVPLRDQSVVRSLKEQKQPLVAEDACNDPLLRPFRDLLEYRRVRSLLGLPLVIDGEAVGCLFVSTNEPRAFNDDEVGLGRSVGGQVAAALARARLSETRHRLEEQYLQAQKMESVGRLAGGVAHDFNNILTVIMGNAELALLDLPPDDPMRAALEGIQDGAAHAASLTRQLLAFARRQIIEPRAIDLNELITHLQKMLHRLIGEDIRIDLQADPDLRQIRADPGQIEQLLLNLVVNARDAMPEGGTLTIRTANLVATESDSRVYPGMAPGNYAQLCVGDTGVGMTEEVRAHVFEPFFTTKEAGKGTGLGLATCFGIVKQSQGFIDFDTEPGRGTTFRIAFPGIKAEDAARIKREALPGLPRGHETILLVEDEPHLRRLVARVLRAQGYTIWEASDGREAMSLVMERGTGFHLLLSDVVMPELSGKTLADQLRSICPEARVLFVSGYISNTVVQEALASSSVAFLQKPFTPSDLVRKVRDVLDAPQRSRKTGSLR